MATESQRISPVTRGWRWLWKMGLAVPLIGGLVIVALAVITIISPGYEAPREIDAGAASDYTFGEPVFFEDERFWLVKQPSGEIIALYDRDPITGCTVPWDPNRELQGKTGWFHDACSQSVYDLTGACFSGPCEIGLNRLNVREEDGKVIVDMSDGGRGALRSENGEPLNPPQ